MLDHIGAAAAPEAPEPGHEKRRHTRHSVAWPAICFAEGGERFEALIVNVSEGGFGLTGRQQSINAGSILYVDFDQIGSFRCRVAWTHENRFGVEISDGEAAQEDTNANFNLTEALQSLKRKI